MAKAKPDERAAIKGFAALLDADKIFGLENPHDGIGAVLDIFSGTAYLVKPHIVMA